MEKNHTPTPWRIRKINSLDNIGYSYAIDHSNGAGWSVGAVANKADGEDRANAAYIVRSANNQAKFDQLYSDYQEDKVGGSFVFERFLEIMKGE